MSSELHNLYGSDRLGSRQTDELIGLARGLLADRKLNEEEVRYLHSWLENNVGITDEPLIHGLLSTVKGILADGVVDEDENKELFDTLSQLTGRSEIGELLKPASLLLCNPAPPLFFRGQRYCFTGTFSYGTKRSCELAVRDRGAEGGNLTNRTDVIVIGTYVTESWKHSSFGNKILRAHEMRTEGLPISIVCEEHWVSHLE